MAKGTEVAEQSAENYTADIVGYADSPEFQWDTVHVEAADQIVFDTPGDLYIGVYAGHEIIYPDPEKKPTEWFVQLKWTDPAGAKFTNAGYEIRSAYTETTYTDDGRPVVTDKIPLGSLTRNQLMKLVDVDQASLMKSFRVDVARRNADNPSA